MASPTHRVHIDITPAYARYVRTRALANLARRTLAAEGVRRAISISIVIADDRTVRSLNRRFLGHDAPTDVLSFALDAGDRFVLPPERPRQLGEIVISYPTASRQARAARHSVQDELSHLVVHGVLHLLGYDHERPRDAKAMRAREDALLGRVAH